MHAPHTLDRSPDGGALAPQSGAGRAADPHSATLHAGYEVDDYRTFLEGKIKLAEKRGFDIDPAEVNPALKDFVRAIVPWALAGGRRAIFSAFGLHKTSTQIELARLTGKHKGGAQLITLPLNVRHEFFDEAEQRFRGEHAVKLNFIRRTSEAREGINLTNFEAVREGNVDPKIFNFASLDEAAVLRSYGSKTYQEFLPLFSTVDYRFVATATPSPNRTKELIHYAGFLGIMDTGQALTRFFQRNSEKAGELTLYPHKEEEFWLWVHSWALFLQKPSDLGFSDDGYVLPALNVHWHEIASDHSSAEPERDGQGRLFKDASLGVTQAAREKRDSLAERVERMRGILQAAPNAHAILWHDLESERHAIAVAVPGARAIYGSQSLEANERNAIDFKHGRFKHLATKAEMSGAGSNFQMHCWTHVFLGIGFKFHDWIQAVHRLLRFGQTHAVELHLIYTEAERDVRRNLEDKWAEHVTMVERMSAIIRRYGLGHAEIAGDMRRKIGVARQEVRGDRFIVANNDAVDEARRWGAEAIDLIVTSIPFADHYEYTEQVEDFGHTDGNAHFWQQMDFLTPELFRILKPGRMACIHVKDRVVFGAVTGTGLPTISPFHAETIFHYTRHGFDYCGMVTVTTDVVRENNQTYRLGYSEMCKDATRVHVGSPEYILYLHKPQGDRSKGYADDRVEKDMPTAIDAAGNIVAWNPKSKLMPLPGTGYSLARWQINAHAFWRSSGNRLITAQEMMSYGPDVLAKVFPAASLAKVYEYEEHVAIGEALAARGALPSIFMALAPGSHHPLVWHDVARMRTLNSEQARRCVEFHICPLQFDIVDRLIEQFSNRDELVYDPFGGLMTVPYRAILRGRRGAGSELNETSFRDGVYYCREAERKAAVPGLFEFEETAEPAA